MLLYERCTRISHLKGQEDGISIGSNDLTQLTLGIDRDSEILDQEFDERDPAVKKMVAISINLDSVMKITLKILETEKSLGM
ncbi:MAG: hypothetical protein JW999_04305 [Methanotrichaceae archaeon]|nr:hypothetical protein [Methanotrichaceae archaeon]